MNDVLTMGLCDTLHSWKLGVVMCLLPHDVRIMCYNKLNTNALKRAFDQVAFQLPNPIDDYVEALFQMRLTARYVFRKLDRMILIRIINEIDEDIISHTLARSKDFIRIERSKTKIKSSNIEYEIECSWADECNKMDFTQDMFPRK